MDSRTWPKAIENKLHYGKNVEIIELQDMVKDLCYELSRQKCKERKTPLAFPTNWYKLKHLNATSSNLEALLAKAKKIDLKVGYDIKHLIKEGKNIHAKEKLNILVSDRYGYKVVGFFEEDDFLTNCEDSKKLHRALKLVPKAIEKEKRGKLESKVIQISLDLNLISSWLTPISILYPISISLFTILPKFRYLKVIVYHVELFVIRHQIVLWLNL